MWKTSKTWKTNGPEDKFMIKLLKSGKITKNSKPNHIKKEYPQIFNDFSNEVIRNHLNELKRKHGIYCEYLNSFLIHQMKFFLLKIFQTYFLFYNF